MKAAVLAFLFALFPHACFAQSLYSVSLPGTTITCTGSDVNVTFKPGMPTGGGVWPTGNFTIRSMNLSVITSDANAQSVVGLLGTYGDTMTPVMIGKGNVRQVAPAGGRPFLVSDPYLAGGMDELHFHVLCAPGGTALINGAIEFSVP